VALCAEGQQWNGPSPSVTGRSACPATPPRRAQFDVRNRGRRTGPAVHSAGTLTLGGALGGNTHPRRCTRREHSPSAVHWAGTLTLGGALGGNIHSELRAPAARRAGVGRDAGDVYFPLAIFLQRRAEIASVGAAGTPWHGWQVLAVSIVGEHRCRAAAVALSPRQADADDVYFPLATFLPRRVQIASVGDSVGHIACRRPVL